MTSSDPSPIRSCISQIDTIEEPAVELREGNIRTLVKYSYALIAVISDHAQE
jgi:hypothetical protein